MEKLKGRELENYKLIMNLLKKTKYWERLSKVPQIRCGHLYYLLHEREITDFEGEFMKMQKLIELTKDDKDFQIILLCYNIFWVFDHKLGPDLLGNYNV